MHTLAKNLALENPTVPNEPRCPVLSTKDPQNEPVRPTPRNPLDSHRNLQYSHYRLRYDLR
jgi:hypothetical protein